MESSYIERNKVEQGGDEGGSRWISGASRAFVKCDLGGTSRRACLGLSWKGVLTARHLA